ncbi:Gmad2 immunoglobulin-like domain-containing protein [Vitreimonas flagellata]|uniref:Gmad2 immunoglobulin-like domain-containing protein n=1 Tax=Vitreimonas flagellata TaxID=2560861 RepID=UPI001431117C|nr:Gmad2 immunoglobulin-like domain-containing protein [Vitreimonas flagellata]
MRRTALILALALVACSPPAPPPPAPEPASPAAVAEEPAINVTAPLADARVTSPLIVEGTAPGDWYFEAQFPLQLRAADGTILAEAPARAQSDWMTEAPVPFRGELRFRVSQGTPATLVLQEDMPGEGAIPREVAIPVVLAPR